MFNFDKLKVDNKTFEFTIHQISPAPTLTVRPATESNKPYFNAVLLRTKKNRRALRKGKINPQMIIDNRNSDRKLFPKHVVEGWKDVTDTDGEQVAYSQDACTEYLAALPDFIFDELRAFCSDPEEMLDEAENAEDSAEK